MLTGETGAGKSIIIDAVNLLLGDRASQEVVRAGAERTEVEGTFQFSAVNADACAALLAEHGLEGDTPDLLVLAREVRANGRSVARVNGRAVNSALLGEIGGLLVDVHGQGEHLSLLREREHVGLLDRYAGLQAQVAEVADLARRVRGLRRELEGLRQDERERARRIDLLTYQVEEIRAAKLQDGRARGAGRRAPPPGQRRAVGASSSAEALQLLQESDGERAGCARRPRQRRAGAEPPGAHRSGRRAPGRAVGARRARCSTIWPASWARYGEEVEFNPRRLAQVEERLHLIHSLQRKYGDTIADVLAYGERAAAELETISHAERAHRRRWRPRKPTCWRNWAGWARRCPRRGGRRANAWRAPSRPSWPISRWRARASACRSPGRPTPTGAVVDAESAAAAGEQPGRYAFDSHGLDAVAFLVSANPGEPLRPLAKVASGGETSRLMLALKTVLGRADETPTLIFDEIDQGIGGRVGGTVGRKLWGLTRDQESGGRSQDGTVEQVVRRPSSIVHRPSSITRCSASPTSRNSPPMATSTITSPSTSPESAR